MGKTGRVGKELANYDVAGDLIAHTVDEIFARLSEICTGWPCRVRSPGAKHPLLFVDYGPGAKLAERARSDSEKALESGIDKGESVFSKLLPGPLVPDRLEWIGNGEVFGTWLHRRATVKFRPKSDKTGTNYVTINNLYQYCGNSRSAEYKAVECRPHWPPIPGHYYAWEPRGNYVADGSALRGLLEFFGNCKDQISTCVALAALMTPGWGAPYGKKPMVVFQAPDRGCGKTTLAECIAKLWHGHLSIDLSGRDQDELVQRLLTPEALTKRIGILDNVKGVLSSAMLEWLVTTELISGKRLYSGDASRPNTINYFITMNGPSCSPDVALRSYFVELQRPTYSTQWDERLAKFVAERGCDVVADVGWLLSRPVQRAPSVVDRWPLWGREVLARAAEFLGIDVDDVMRRTSELRKDCDDEADECAELMAGVLRIITGLEYVMNGDQKVLKHSRGYIVNEFNVLRQTSEISVKADDQVSEVFLSSTEMVDLWRLVLGGKLKPRQIFRQIVQYLGAGKLPQLMAKKTEAANGYLLAREEIVRFLGAYRKQLEIQEVVK